MHAAKSLRLLLPFAHQLGINPIWITCDPDNLASRRTLESIGARLIETVSVPPDYIIHKSGHPQKCRYRITFDQSPLFLRTTAMASRIAASDR